MTIALLVVGAVAALLGTRLAALAFIAAAAAAAVDATGVAVTSRELTMAAIGVWTATTAAGWLLLTRDTPRRVAVPALGLAAVLAAGAAPNGAVLLGCWLLGTGAAVISRSHQQTAGRWALAVCGLDVLVVAAIASTMAQGFEGWPQTLQTPGAVALLLCAIARAPLAAGPDDGTPLPGLLIVRAQSAVLVAFAVGAGTGRSFTDVAVVATVAVFAVAPYVARRGRVADVVQELALVGLVVASARAGWGPSGWAWGALAAGTLIHHLRFTVGRTTLAPYLAALSSSAGIGLPFVPVLVAQLEGATSAPRLVAGVVLVGTLAGLAGRQRVAPPVARRAATPTDDVRAAAVLVTVAVAAVLAVVFTAPSPPAPAAGAGPAVWAGIAVLAAAVGATGLGRVVGRERPPSPLVWPAAITSRVALVDRWTSDRVLWAALALLGVAAAAMWLLGSARGFL